MASIIWKSDNLFDKMDYTTSGSVTYSSTRHEIKLFQNGSITFSHGWDATATTTSLALDQLKLSMIVDIIPSTTQAYDTSFLVLYRYTYWENLDQDVPTKSPPITVCVPNQSVYQDDRFQSILQFDGSKLIADFSITIKATFNNNNTSLIDLEKILLVSNVTNMDTIRNEINSAAAMGILTSVDFYTDGFKATYTDKTLTYKYLVQSGELTGLIHIPTGNIVYITDHQTPIK